MHVSSSSVLENIIGDKIITCLFYVLGIFFGNYYRKLYSIILGGINYCNVTIGTVLPWKERMFWLRLQFFSPCYVGINYCNVTPFLYRILSFQNTIRTSGITLHHFIFRQLISVIITPPIPPNNFSGFNKRSSQENCTFLCFSLLGRSTPPITPKYSQRISWRNRFHLCYTRKFFGN